MNPKITTDISIFLLPPSWEKHIFEFDNRFSFYVYSVMITVTKSTESCYRIR